MKTGALIFVMTLSLMSLANDGKYLEVMNKNIEAVYKGQTIEELQQAVNTLNRVADAEKTKWEPYYYSAFGSVMMANREKDAIKKDGYLDLALVAVEKAKAIKENESEIIAMEGFIHMIRLTVDPATRGQQYSGMAMQNFGKAIELNPENPRALSLLAQMQFGTARFFNSPATEACGTVTKALEKFETFKSENPLAPVWGKGMTEALKKNCQ